MKPRTRRRLPLISACLVVCLAFGMLSSNAVPASRAMETTATGGVEDIVSLERRLDNLETAVADHRSEIDNLEDLTGRLENLQGAIRAEIQVYGSQNAVHRQMLLSSRLLIEDLENADNNNRRALQKLSGHMEAFQERWDTSSAQLQQTEDRIELARSQLYQIEQASMPEEQRDELKKATLSLLQLLKKKRNLHTLHQELCRKMILVLDAPLNENKAIGEKLALQLEGRDKASLFTRIDRLQQLSGRDLQQAFHFTNRRIRSFFSISTWKAQLMKIKMEGFSQWIVFFALLVSLTVLQGRFRLIAERIAANWSDPRQYYRHLGLLLIQRSLLLMDLTLLFGIYNSFDLSLLDIGLGRFLFEILLLFLVTRWGLDFLALGFQGAKTELGSFVSSHLSRYFRFLRGFGAGIILLEWVAGRATPLTLLSMDVLSVISFIWVVAFWHQFDNTVSTGVRKGEVAPKASRRFFFKFWSKIVFGFLMLLNIAGYGFLAEYWVGAWIKTVTMLFLGWLGWKAISEWRSDHQAEATPVNEEKRSGSVHQLKGMLIQDVRLAWLFVLAAGVLWSWERSGFILSALIRLLNATVTIGSIALNVRNVTAALIVLIATHGTVGIGLTLLHEKFLDQRPLEPGLKHSIIAITRYLGWGIGLVLALGILGINATSLAVVFGALSIGIGFGLQTIFNNFISGLILLFERPIQVGDIIEVNGLWSEVKKINVRATVVQTFDNASVIIPNSELISREVTNWSFKDKRMRRNLEVGIAYGSDIDQVKATLIEIAQETKAVLKHPRPDVIFINHAESALIFRLRVWVHVDDFWSAPSHIRSEIDRRFRELGIEIAYPQRDIHIRTMTCETQLAGHAEKSSQPHADGTPAPA